MKYCVIKDTTKVIDGSDNPMEIMLQNAQSAGFVEADIEILTAEEYEVKKALEPIPPHPPSPEEKITQLEQSLAETNAMMLEFMESILI